MAKRTKTSLKNRLTGTFVTGGEATASEFVSHETDVIDSLRHQDDPVGDANVQSDWTETDSTDDSFIQNKPTIPDALTDVQIGDKAFSNPPSDLNDTEKRRVRDAIGTSFQDVSHRFTTFVSADSEIIFWDRINIGDSIAISDNNDYTVVVVSKFRSVDSSGMNYDFYFRNGRDADINNHIGFTHSNEIISYLNTERRTEPESVEATRHFYYEPIDTNTFEDLTNRINVVERDIVQSDWDEIDPSENSFIQNKPTIPPALTDAQIGDKAFSNPPSDLTNTEQQAVRTAIGAGTGGGGGSSVGTLSLTQVGNAANLSNSAADTGIDIASLSDVFYVNFTYRRQGTARLNFTTIFLKSEIGDSSSNSTRIQFQGGGGSYIGIYQSAGNLWFTALPTDYDQASVRIYNTIPDSTTNVRSGGEAYIRSNSNKNHAVKVEVEQADDSWQFELDSTRQVTLGTVVIGNDADATTGLELTLPEYFARQGTQNLFRVQVTDVTPELSALSPLAGSVFVPFSQDHSKGVTIEFDQTPNTAQEASNQNASMVNVIFDHDASTLSASISDNSGVYTLTIRANFNHTLAQVESAVEAALVDTQSPFEVTILGSGTDNIEVIYPNDFQFEGAVNASSRQASFPEVTFTKTAAGGGTFTLRHTTTNTWQEIKEAFETTRFGGSPRFDGYVALEGTVTLSDAIGTTANISISNFLGGGNESVTVVGNPTQKIVKISYEYLFHDLNDFVGTYPQGTGNDAFDVVIKNIGSYDGLAHFAETSKIIAFNTDERQPDVTEVNFEFWQDSLQGSNNPSSFMEKDIVVDRGLYVLNFPPLSGTRYVHFRLPRIFTVNSVAIQNVNRLSAFTTEVLNNQRIYHTQQRLSTNGAVQLLVEIQEA